MGRQFLLATPAALLLIACRTASLSREAPTSIRVAVCQVLVDGDLESAFERVQECLRTAAGQKAELACFPEACLLGWVNPAAHGNATEIPGATTDRLAALAKSYDLMVAIGITERAGEHLHNAGVLLDRDGSLLLHHRKSNILTELMSPPYTPGDGSTSVVETRYGRMGMLICADIFQEPQVEALAAAEPRLVVIPFGWAAEESAWPGHADSLHAWIRHAARTTKAPVVGVDSVGSLLEGPWKGYALGGQSAISTADGSLMEPLGDRRAEVRVFEVELD